MKNYCLFLLLLLANTAFTMEIDNNEDENIDQKYSKKIQQKIKELKKSYGSEKNNSSAKLQDLEKDNYPTKLAQYIHDQLEAFEQPSSPKKGQTYRYGASDTTKKRKKFYTLQTEYAKVKLSISKINQHLLEERMQLVHFHLFVDGGEGTTLSIYEIIDSAKSSNFNPQTSQSYKAHEAESQPSDLQEKSNKKITRAKSLRKSFSDLFSKKSNTKKTNSCD